MAEIKAMENPTLKVPYEVLNKKFRITQKTLDRELNQITSAATELERGLQGDGKNAPLVGEISRLLDGVVQKLQVLKRKAEENISEELSAGFVCKKRLEHLKQNVINISNSTSNNNISSNSNAMSDDESMQSNETLQLAVAASNQWKKVRLNRMIVEHFLRLGYYESAETLANRSGIRDLTNIDIFQTSREVERDLASHSISKCLLWCNDNKSKLRKINSNIEFRLRVQEFIELIRENKRMMAVKHAQKFFPSFEQEQLKEIKKCMALLAFPIETELEPYKTLFDPQRWSDLIISFRLENYRIFQIPTQSVLSVAVQTGLSALKTPQCYSTNSKNPNCPVCQPNINEMAENLPFSHCAQSRLMCRVTKKPLNEYNLPMMLPNGQIFGQQALPEITKENGVVVCPITNEKFTNAKLEKVFIM